MINRVKVPTFLVGGEYDLFQRGTPLLFENLRKRGVPTKMIIGPWDHLEGSSGADVGKAGHGTLAELQLRWFDRYVRGIEGPDARQGHPADHLLRAGQRALDQGAALDRQRTGAESFRLSGSATAGGGTASLTPRHGRGRVRRTSRPSRSPACAPARPTSGPPGSRTRAGPTCRA